MFISTEAECFNGPNGVRDPIEEVRNGSIAWDLVARILCDGQGAAHWSPVTAGPSRRRDSRASHRLTVRLMAAVTSGDVACTEPGAGDPFVFLVARWSLGCPPAWSDTCGRIPTSAGHLSYSAGCCSRLHLRSAGTQPDELTRPGRPAGEHVEDRETQQ
jgi:hypothetical protein